MIKNKLQILLMVILLAACNSPNVSRVTDIPPSETTEPTDTFALPSPTVTVFHQPTESRMNATLTPSESPTSQLTTPMSVKTVTATSLPNLITKCVEIGSEMPLESVAHSGTVVITPLNASPYLLDLQTGQSHDLPMNVPDHHLLADMEVSPDRNRLAYVETTRNQGGDIVGRHLWVVTADGQVLASRAFELGWSWMRWLDNERLEIYWWEAPTASTVIILNPFNGEQQVLTPSFPDIYNDSFNPSYWMVMYSPDLEWVLYLSNDDRYLGKAVVWDLVKGNVIWQHAEEGVGTITQIPEWSPLGDQVAVVVGNHLFRVDRSGQAIPLPDIGEDGIRSFSWSPDGNQISFWASSHVWETLRLFILDTTNNQVVDLCMDTPWAESYPPEWSPNGLQFTLIAEEIVVNINKGTANLIPHEEMPHAWMRSMP